MSNDLRKLIDDRFLRACVVSAANVAILIGFCIVVVFGGHGFAPAVVLIAGPPEYADFSDCMMLSLAWGGIATLLVASLIRSGILRSLIRCVGAASLIGSWILIYRLTEDDTFAVSAFFISSLPFLVCSLVHPTIMVSILRSRTKRADWQFTIRDVLALQLVVPAFVFPWLVYFR